MIPQRRQEVAQLYQEALTRPPAERRAYLDARCGSDHALRSAVEALLVDPDAPTRLSDAQGEHRVHPDDQVPSPLIGRRVGVYDVQGLIGRGGMGEVYRGRDTRLNRDVAIKVVRSAFLRNAESLARFEREARLLAALNHPNIAAIYGIEEIDIPDPSEPVRVPVLILELVEGQSLAERLRTAPVPVQESLALASQIADALQAAHGAGIVHRDLKPANVTVTTAGAAKVVDFGIAKAAAGSFVAAQDETAAATVEGLVIGTPGYMSPEQAAGEPVDERADTWAFGCLLFEMLSGRRPHPRNASGSDAGEPEWHRLPRETPASIRRLLRDCLQPEPGLRLRDIGRARTIVDAARARPRLSRATLAATALVIALGAALLWWMRPQPSSIVDPSEWVQLTNFPDAATQPALSPDGRLVAFIRGPYTFVGPGQIYVKQLPDGEAVQLTDDAFSKMSPVFSPDGARIAYTVDGFGERWATWVVETYRGTPRRWMRNASGLIWPRPGHLLYAEIREGTNGHMGLVATTEARTERREVYFPAHESAMAHRFAASPDGAWILIVEMDAQGVWLPCRLQRLEGTAEQNRTVGPPASRCTDVAWAPDGRTMFFTADAGDGFHLWRQAFPDGVPQRMTTGPTSEEGLALTPDGHSLVTSVGARQRGIWIRSAAGDREISGEGYSFWPLFTQDGRWLTYRRSAGVASGSSPTELWVMEIESGRSERVLAGMLVTQYDLSPDGRIVATVPGAGGANELWVAWADGREAPRRIPGATGTGARIGPGGDFLFLLHEGSSAVLARVAAAGGAITRISGAPPGSVLGQVSPDGKWLSVSARGAGVLTAIDGTPATVRLSTLPYVRARWSADGRRFYLSIGSGQASAFGVGQTYILPVPEGSMLPDLPPDGFASEAEIAAAPGVQILPYGDVAPGTAPGLMAFSREIVTRNLYRIPIR